MRPDALLPRAQVRSLSRLRGRQRRPTAAVLKNADAKHRLWVRVSPQVTLPEGREPPPAALFERVDLPRKRERWSELAARVNQS
jgi:hypothetical protein